MGLLLDAWRTIAADGTQQLTLVHVGGKIETVPAPILPYFYLYGTQDEVMPWLAQSPVKTVRVTEQFCKALSDLEELSEPWCKVEVKNVNEVTTVNKYVGGSMYPGWTYNERTLRILREQNWAHKDIMRRPAVLAENHLGFVERVMADKPGWFDEQTEKTVADLTYIWLDIEQSSSRVIGETADGKKIYGFPDDNDPIISIAWEAAGPNVPEHLREGIVIINEEDQKLERKMPNLGSVKLWDHRILREFAEVFAAINADVVVVFNGHDFDLPMITKRCRAVQLSPKFLCRHGVPRFEEDKVGMWEKMRTILGGRIVYDVFERVFLDQSLNGKVKDRGLKTVARYRGLHVEEIDAGLALEEWKNDRERFISYNKNDVKLTRALGMGYWENFLVFSKMMQAPLRFIVDGSANFFGTRVSAEDFQYAPSAFHQGFRVLSDGTNYERYEHVDALRPPDPEKKEGTRVAIVTGARVGIRKTGVFAQKETCALHAKPEEGCTHCFGTWKVDVGAMYPSILESLGLGPDNTVWVAFEQPEDWPIFYATYVEGTPCKDSVDAWREYHIPDHKWGGRHVIRVYGRSKLSERITQAKANRKKIKAEMEKWPKDSLEYKALDAQQDALKVWQNSVYGNLANEWARYGGMAVSMTITGIGRLIGELIESTLGDAAIETDTDGVYSSAPVDQSFVNKTITDFVKTRCLVDKNTIKVEVDEYVKSFFHSEKNYILLTDTGKLVKHGSAIIGTKHCALWDDAVDRAVGVVFGLTPSDAYKLWRESTEAELKLGRLPLDRLVQRQRIKKTTEYASNAQGRQIAVSHVQTYGREPHPDSAVAFVHTRSGFEVAAAPGVARRIDVKHYVGLLKDVEDLFRLGKPKPKQMTFKDILA